MLTEEQIEASNREYAKRLQKEAVEKFSLQLNILSNAVADVMSEDEKVRKEALKTLRDHRDGYWHTLVVLNSTDMRSIMGED